MPSRRRLARISAMQSVFVRQHRSVDVAEALAHNVAEFGGEKSVDAAYAAELVNGVVRHDADIGAAIERHAPAWPLERMDTLTRSILLVAAYELLFGRQAPPAVVMNEAIEIAKEYGPAESPKFVNGVLNAVAKGSVAPLSA